MADTGADEDTARAMVADVRQRESASPHAPVVSAAANAILAPIVEVFRAFFAELGRAVMQWAQAVAITMRPIFSALEALREDRCTVDSAHDATQWNGYHLDASDV